MTAVVLYKLLAIGVAAALGFVATRARWLGSGDAARLLSNIAFFIFVPALLFRTAARIDFQTLPWRTLAAYYVPVLLLQTAVYLQQRRRGGARAGVVALSACFGNTAQIGIPMAQALFGETGLAIHITLLSLHALALLSMTTTFVELDLAREARHGRLSTTLAMIARNTVVHPVVLPVLLGLAYNLTGWPLPVPVDEALVLLASGVVPVCLVLIGVSLATYGLGGGLRGTSVLVVIKLVLQPLLVLLFAHYALGLAGLPLSVAVLMAALPTGSNALIFAQRYEAAEGEATAAIVLSTVAFAIAAPLWLAVLARL